MIDALRALFLVSLGATVMWLAYLSWVSRNHE
jgi:hypothetical protein